MKYVKRGRGSRRIIDFCAVAALGLALSGCGGSGASSSAAPSVSSSAATQSSTAGSLPAQGSASSSPSSGTAPASGAPTGSSGSGSAPSSPPTATTGEVTLNWTPPTENMDNSPLTNLAGYDIHYGPAAGQYTQTIAINNPGIATYVVSNLSPGTYYFSVTAVNSQGTESPLSSEVSTTVN